MGILMVDTSFKKHIFICGFLSLLALLGGTAFGAAVQAGADQAFDYSRLTRDQIKANIYMVRDQYKKDPEDGSEEGRNKLAALLKELYRRKDGADEIIGQLGAHRELIGAVELVMGEVPCTHATSDLEKTISQIVVYLLEDRGSLRILEVLDHEESYWKKLFLGELRDRFASHAHRHGYYRLLDYADMDNHIHSFALDQLAKDLEALCDRAEKIKDYKTIISLLEWMGNIVLRIDRDVIFTRSSTLYNALVRAMNFLLASDTEDTPEITEAFIQFQSNYSCYSCCCPSRKPLRDKWIEEVTSRGYPYKIKIT